VQTKTQSTTGRGVAAAAALLVIVGILMAVASLAKPDPSGDNQPATTATANANRQVLLEVKSFDVRFALVTWYIGEQKGTAEEMPWSQTFAVRPGTKVMIIATQYPGPLPAVPYSCVIVVDGVTVKESPSSTSTCTEEFTV
jgi:hypothetical protein